MAASENPHAHAAVVQTAGGTRTRPADPLFLERYVQSYLRAWDAFVRAVRPARRRRSGPPTPARRW